MFTILMDASKYLTVTTPEIRLFQGDNYVDTFQICIPYMYNEIDLRPYTIIMEYKDEYQNSFVDILNKDEELYKNKYIRCTLPVTTEITRSAGNIILKLSLNYVDKDKLIQYSMHTSELKIHIHKNSDYYKFSDNSLQKIDTLIGELSSKIDYLSDVTESISKDFVDDLLIDNDGDLHVSSKGRVLGNGVSVALPSETDDDGTPDAVYDLDSVYSTVSL